MKKSFDDLRLYRRFFLADFFLLPRYLSLMTGCFGPKKSVRFSSEDRSESDDRSEPLDEELLLLDDDEPFVRRLSRAMETAGR